MSLIGAAMAGGLAGFGAGVATVGRDMERERLERLRGEIETDRQAALARLQSDLRRGDARYAANLADETAERDRGRVRGIIDGATATMRDEQRPASEIRRAGRDALAAAGRIKEAADYDKATEPDKPTVVTTPYGSRSTVLDRSGNVAHVIDNSTDIRAENDRLRAERPGTTRGGAPRQLTQDDVNKIQDQAIKLADRLAAENPHPLADPLSTDKDARKDTALMSAAREYYTRAMQNGLARGEIVDPAKVEGAIREVAGVAHQRALAKAEAAAAQAFDAKGRPLPGAEATLREMGVTATDRTSFIRAARDQLLGQEMRAVFDELRQRSGGGESAPGDRPAPTRAEPQPEPPVTEGERPDDPTRMARRPTGAGGIIGGVLAEPKGPSAPNDADMAMVEREQREIEAGKRRDFSPAARAVLERMDAEQRRRNDDFKAREQQRDLERSRAAARAARGG